MKEYFSFKGRTKRQEYWATLIVSLVALVMGLVLVEETGALTAVIALASFVASLWLLLAVTVKRLRDAGLSTMWALVLFVPYIATVASIVFGCIASADGDHI